MSEVRELRPAKNAVSPEVVAMLRDMLAKAESGELVSIAIAGEMTGKRTVTAVGSAEEFDLVRMLGSLEILKLRVLAHFDPEDGDGEEY